MNSVKSLSPPPAQEAFDLVPVFARGAVMEGQPKVAKCCEYLNLPQQAILSQVLRCAHTKTESEEPADVTRIF